MKKLLIPILFFPFAACKQTTTGSDKPAPALGYRMETFIKDSCPDDRHCGSFNLQYPFFETGDSMNCLFMNRAEQADIRDLLVPNSTEPFATTLETVALGFAEDFLNAMRAKMGFDQNWKYATSGNVVYQNEKLITVFYQKKVEKPGVPTVTGSALYSYSKPSASHVVADGIFTDVANVRLLTEMAFRKSKGFGPQESLQNVLLPEHQIFPLTKFIGVTETGIQFHYPAGVYTKPEFGTFDVQLPFAVVESKLRKEQVF